MFSKIAILACVLTIANAGYLGTAPVTTYAAAPSYTTSYAAPAPIASYAAPAYTTSYASPSYAYASEPTLSATSENTYRSAGNLHTVSTQSKSIATPFSTSNKHFTKYTNPAVYAQATTYTAGAPVAYAAAPVAHAPVAYSAPAPTVAHGAGLLGVAYSPAVAVSHMTYNSPTIGYGW